MRILNVVGTRPNLIKIAPLVCEMNRATEIESILVHTGQHYDQNMSGVFFEELGIPEPNYQLEVGSGTHAWQTAQIMLALEPVLLEVHPDIVLVVGDVNSTLAASVVAAKLGFPLAHVEAGLRSFDRTMPEEINRILTDAVGDYLFTTERSASENLRCEGISEAKIFFVGNVMVDSLIRNRRFAEDLEMPGRFGLPVNGYALLTLHRPSSVDAPTVLAEIVDALAAIQTTLPIVFPVHPRTLKRLGEFSLLERAEALAGLRMVGPLGYLEFLGLMAQARFVLTDSGGIQEETTALGVPCLTLRENTERPITITEGTNELVGTSAARIVDTVRRVLNDDRKTGRCPELWDGRAAERIISVLRKTVK